MSETKPTLRELIARREELHDEIRGYEASPLAGGFTTQELEGAAQEELMDISDKINAALADLESRAATGDAVEAMLLHHRIGRYEYISGGDAFEYEEYLEHGIGDGWAGIRKGATVREALGLAPEVKS